MNQRPNCSNSLLPLSGCFKSHMEMTQKQTRENHLLEPKNMQRGGILEGQANQHIEDQNTIIDKLHRKLAIHEQNELKAAQTIDMLTRQVEALQVTTARAEEAQRNAEADYILRHFVGNEDDTANGSGSASKERQFELAHMAKLQALTRVSELQIEVTLIRDVAEALSRELQDVKDAKSELEDEFQKTVRLKSEVQYELQQLKDASEMSCLREPNVKTVESAVADDQMISMPSVCQKLVTTLKAQVKTLADDKKKLNEAISCCQQAADSRFKALVKDQQKIEAENYQLRTDLTRLRQNTKDIRLEFRKLEEDSTDGSLAVEELMHVLQTQALQKELTCRIHDIEQKVAVLADTEARNKSLVVERSELLKQLKAERCHSSELAHSNKILKTATETALNQLREVESELCAISSDRDSSVKQHENVATLARRVITELKRQQAESMDAAVASMQIYHLTSSLRTHLQHLRALRKTYDNNLLSGNSESESDSDSEIITFTKYEELLVEDTMQIQSGCLKKDTTSMYAKALVHQSPQQKC
ncbi:hypothetical protein Plhal710r2_c033g0121381 [Plasmopara halstedii]